VGQEPFKKISFWCKPVISLAFPRTLASLKLGVFLEFELFPFEYIFSVSHEASERVQIVSCYLYIYLLIYLFIYLLIMFYFLLFQYIVTLFFCLLWPVQSLAENTVSSYLGLAFGTSNK